MGLKERTKRLERRAEGRSIRIPQPDGPPAKFPPAALAEAFLANMARLRGEEIEPHPLSVAAANSSDPAGRDNFIAGEGVIVNEKGEEVGPPPDLSE